MLSRLKIFGFLLLSIIIVGSSTGAQDLPRLGARYNYKFYDCEIGDNQFSVKAKIKLTIYNKVGEDYRYVVFSETKFIDLKDVKMRVLDCNGKTIYEKDKKDMTKFSGYDGSSLYSDINIYQIELRCNQFPYSIEYEYTNVYKSLFFWRYAGFQDYIPIDTVEYNIATPPLFSYQYKVYGGEIDYTVRTKDGRRVETFYAAGVPELKDIDYLPPGARFPLSIRFAADYFELEGFRMENLSWDGIGDWYNELTRAQYDLAYSNEPPMSTKDAILEAYNSVIENVRYVAIQIGLGGWQPYNATTTRERGFGDCKDMATLLVSKLKNRGVTAYPVLVLTKDEGPLDVNFPNTDFNHVIVVALDGNDTTWMDATCNSCPLGELPTGDEDIDVLVITPDGGVIRRTPASTSFDNREVRNTSLFIRDDLLCEIELTKTGYGNYGRYLRSRFNGTDNEDVENYLLRQLNGGSNKFELLDYQLSDLDKIDQPFQFTAKYRSKKKIDKLGPNFYVDPFLNNKPYGQETVNFLGREYPIEIIYPYTELDTIIVTWDSSFSFRKFKLPEAHGLTTDFGSIKTATTTDSSSVTTTFEKSYFHYQIEPDQFSMLTLFNGQLKEITSEHIKLSQ